MESVMDALDRYIEAKADLAKERDEAQCSDWDCGISSELDSSISEGIKRERVARARADLGESLDAYIAARIRSDLGR